LIKTFITKLIFKSNTNRNVYNKDFKPKSNQKTVNKLNNIQKRNFSSSSNYTNDNKEISLIDNKPNINGNDNKGKDNEGKNN
jgi:hypothetical protein